MKIRQTLLELPAGQRVLEEIIADPQHDLKSTALSSVVHDGKVKHFVLVVWNDRGAEHHTYMPGPQD